MKVLFVCSGNTCRSPLAEAAWRAFAPGILRGTPEAGATASSCGLSTFDGSPVSPHSVSVARGWGVDISGHRSRLLRPEDVQRATVVCVMTADHARLLSAVVPDARVRLLGEFAPVSAKEDVPPLLAGLELGGEAAGAAILDPYGGSLEAYQACGERIRRAVEGVAQALACGELC